MPDALRVPLVAAYFDGHSSRRHTVTLTVADGELSVGGDGVDRREALSAVRVSEPMGPARILSFADGAHCEVIDLDGLSRLLDATGHRDRWVVRMQRRWDIALASMGIIAGVLALGYVFVLPWAAERIAAALPEAVVSQIERNVMAQVDYLLPPSELAASRQEALRSRLAATAALAPGAPAARVMFRKGGPIGANAFALPGGQIVVTDELVALAKDDDDVVAVMSHELGHVAGRHGLRQAVQSTVVGLVAGWMLGDFSSIVAIAPTVYLQTRYSRDFEREADDYGAHLMRANGLPPSRLADMLERMQAVRPRLPGKSNAAQDKQAEDMQGKDEQAKERQRQPGMGDYFSTHPSTEERLRRLREM